MTYSPRSSGLLTGGGFRHSKARRSVIRGHRLRHFPDVHISDSSAVKQIVPNFDPELEFEYSERELLLLAEKILLEDEKPPMEHPAWLSVYKLKQRMRREIYTATGTPDPSIASGLYWRTHPEGRKWYTKRSDGRGFYGK